MIANNAYNVYKNNSVNYASKDQLLLMLVDGAVKYSKIGRQAIGDKDVKKSHENIVKTQDIFYELLNSLDRKSGLEWVDSMESIYLFIIDRLVQANIKKDVAIMDEVIPLIENVRDTWHEAYKIAKNVR